MRLARRIQLLIGGVASSAGRWITLPEITSRCGFCSLEAATKAERLRVFDCLCNGCGGTLSREPMLAGGGELSLWVHRMIKLSEMRKSRVVGRWSMMRCVVVGSI